MGKQQLDLEDLPLWARGPVNALIQRAQKAEADLLVAASERDIARTEAASMREKLWKAGKLCPGICGASAEFKRIVS